MRRSLRTHLSILFALSLLLKPDLALAASGPLILASKLGAKLNSNLKTGGGTDDTAILQSALDRAKNGQRVHLVVDGPALISGLELYANTLVECTAKGGFFLRDGSSRAILRNAHRSRSVIADHDISIIGCFLNGNRNNQPSANIGRGDIPDFEGPSNKEPDGTYITGIQLLGVRNSTIDHVTLWNIRAFGVLVGNAEHIDIRNIRIDHGQGVNAPPESILNTDGIHLKGPLRFVTIDHAAIRVGDDAIALNANDYETNDITKRNDFGPYVGQGPIQDVRIHDIDLDHATLGLRLLSSNEVIDRILVDGVRGSVKQYFITISHWLNPTDFGNIGSVEVRNVDITRPAVGGAGSDVLPGTTPSAVRQRVEFNDFVFPLININARANRLTFKNIRSNMPDARPLLRLGPETDVKRLIVSLSASGPLDARKRLQVDRGASVSRLVLDLVGR